MLRKPSPTPLVSLKETQLSWVSAGNKEEEVDSKPKPY
jgi:hypothetical protein